MRKMYSLNQLIALIKQYADVSPEKIEEIIAGLESGSIAVNVGLDGYGNLVKQSIMEMLTGKVVRIMQAPESTTLTDEQMAQIIGGAFMEGTFLGMINPVFYATTINSGGNAYYGFCVGHVGDQGTLFEMYKIVPSTKVISSTALVLMDGYYGYFNIYKPMFNHKEFPINYPADTKIGQLLCRKGTLTWYVPVAVTGITSGDDLDGVQDTLVNAMKDHLDVEINGHRCRFEKDDGTYVMYSWKDEVDTGANLQVNMISLLIASPNTISFNLMKFVPTT